MIKKVRSRVKAVWAGLALLSAEMAIIILLFIIALFGFLYMVRRVFVLENNGFDESVYAYLGQFVSAPMNSFMVFITFFGTHLFLIPANLLLVIYFLAVRKHTWYSVKIAAIALSSVALMFILKALFGRPRPEVPLLEAARGLSFPSGHALMSVTFYGLMGYIVWHLVQNTFIKWLLITCFAIMVFLIGLSRIYLHVHYTSDVIAGYSMGVLWLVISLKLLRRFEKYSKRKLDPIVVEKVEVVMPEGSRHL